MARKSEFGRNWWAQRWIQVLEDFGWDSRLQRGRSYARAGRVLEINVGKGTITARVSGSRPKPYKVVIELAPLSDRDWESVLQVMARQAVFAAKLLSGQMPQDVEEAFKESRVSLFPASDRDMDTDCSCPDWANPCKHIAAVYYLLGSEFDRDPFLLFLLRGRTKEEALATLRALRAVDESGADASPAEDVAPPAVETAPPLNANPQAFWALGEALYASQIAISPPKVSEAILKRLGPPPFAQSTPAIMRSLIEMYQTVSREALDLAYTDESSSAKKSE